MKKIFKYILFSLLLFSIVILNSNASTFTYTRTDDDLRVPSDIKLPENKKFWIMKTPSVNEKEKIYDFAELIDDSYEDKIYSKITEFINKHDIDMVVVTINNNNTNCAQEYADNFFDYNYFGKNSSRDGILLLIDMDTREIYISTSGKGILIYDDKRIDNMLDSLEYYVVLDDYASGVVGFISDASEYASKGIPLSNRNYKIDKYGNYVEVPPIFWTIILIISLMVTGITMFILTSKHKLIKPHNNAVFYLDRKSVNVKNRVDKFISTNTTSVYVPPSSSSGSGSSGGGSSTHRSSSGRSHGGGGRRF